MHPRLKAAALIPLGTLTFLATGGMPEPEPRLLQPALPLAAQDRHFLDARFDTLSLIGGVNDSLLLNPIRLVATRELIYVFDSGDQALKAFRISGELAWRFGRHGSGPGEFRKVRDIAAGIDGGVVLVDQANARLTAISPEGHLRREVALRSLDGSPEQIIQLAPDRYLLWVLSNGNPLVVIDTLGAILRRSAIPFRVAAEVPFLGAQAYLTNDPKRPNEWIYAFLFVDNWRLLTDLAPSGEENTYVESLPKPEVRVEDRGVHGISAQMGQAVRGPVSTALSNEKFFVLFGGQSRERRRIVDIYGAATGAYAGSVLLSGPGAAIAVEGDVMSVMSSEPYPQILTVRFALTQPEGP